MKAIFYIDGFNLYYGCLKYTPYKWLDLFKLSQTILKKMNNSPGEAELVQVKYFTSPIRAVLATRKLEASKAQADYIRALERTYPEKICTIQGYFTKPCCEPMCEYTEGEVADKSKRLMVWRIEEKQTDVNMAIEIYRDAMKGNADMVVVISNDSDLETPIRAVKEDFPDVKIGVVMPVRHDTGSTARPPPPNRRLKKHSHWTRSHILETELESCQLPPMIPTNKRPIRKPSYW